ncbi:MAG TPA: PQQ-dependent sugar dehydrogenase [Chitinophagaceae bacterium]|nr:PQQ-dependent sugar dehydrogenase [Chitinophagaceae bacterium]
MKNKFIILFFVAPYCTTCNDNKSQLPIQSQSSDAVVRLVKKGLNYPWEIIWGKDNHIWMTERDGKISRIDPANGNTTFSFTISEVESRNEGGLLGMALHPDFQHNHSLYVVYNYNKANTHLEKLVRYTYANNTLSNPVVLLDGIVGSTNHNGSRLWITNEANPKIFMTTGDAFDQSLSQPTNTLNGKVLHINLDGSIPSDNPFPNNPVWSYGHRNPQGLVVVNNIMYASEHGPSEEDEVNIIEKGRNYGWPNVEGPCNGDEAAFCKSHNVKEPIWSSGDNTLAVCGLDYYNNDRIPQWKNSLLMMTLKNSSIRQLQLSGDGKSIVNTKTYFENKWGRLRDLCISPDGKVYICTSNGGNSDVIVEISKL